MAGGRHVFLLPAKDLEELIGRQVLPPEQDLTQKQRRLPAAHGLLLPERLMDLGARDIAQTHGDLAEETAPRGIGGEFLELRFLNPESLRELGFGQVLRLDEEPADRFLDLSHRLQFEAFLELLLLEEAFLERDLSEEMRILSSVHP
jgi:hypothetical protein